MRNGSKRNNTAKKTTTTNKSTEDNMKYEIASEFGVTLGPDSTSRANGTVGGEMTKRLVDKGRGNKSK